MSQHPSKTSPLVLVHGFRGAPLGLQAIATQLQNLGYQVYVPAIPPFANAEPLQKYDIQHYISFLQKYITDHHLEHPTLIGHSMGSIICAAMGEHYPEILSNQIILLSPISQRTNPFLGTISSLSAILPRRVVDYVTTRFLFVPKDRHLFKQTMEITHQCSACSRATCRAEIAAANFSTRHAVGDFQLSQNVLLLAGEHDHIMPKIATEQLAAKNNHTHVYFLPHTGHLHNYEDPLGTTEAIHHFLQEYSTED